MICKSFDLDHSQHCLLVGVYDYNADDGGDDDDGGGLYAAPAWWGFLSMAEKDHLQSVIRKSKRYGFLPGNFQNACDIVESLKSNIFRSVCGNLQHVLFRLPPPEKATGYNLRQRSYQPTRPQIGNNNFIRNFVYRMLFKESY